MDDSVFRQGQQGNSGSTVYAKKNFHAYTYRNVDLPPGIIQIENADGITLRGNTVQHTGADGICMVNDVTDAQLIGNVTNDIAGSAITVGHPQHVYIGDYTSTNNEKYPVNVEGVCRGAQPDREVPVGGHHPRLGLVELRRFDELHQFREPDHHGEEQHDLKFTNTYGAVNAARRHLHRQGRHDHSGAQPGRLHQDALAGARRYDDVRRRSHQDQRERHLDEHPCPADGG
ncbi:hypothetical protein [Streptomyces sp. AC495_CC817]|uniref:hypothetical protein n=1 Tax=Streptomyces sp. AC495_CC817 TaxID=2823900 RepID=UPI0027E13858|nr:hypothetical protein [Streptomyces sp. AC495_CC817]